MRRPKQAVHYTPKKKRKHWSSKIDGKLEPGHDNVLCPEFNITISVFLTFYILFCIRDPISFTQNDSNASESSVVLE
jgi:hypothetical protein